MTKRQGAPGKRVMGLHNRHAALAALALALAAAACDRVDRPNRPLPDFQAQGLDGTEWSRERLAGKPWVINLWVPG